MTFTIEIDTDNAAFEYDKAVELARILRDVAEQLEHGEDFSHAVPLFDFNGNDVGRAKLA